MSEEFEKYLKKNRGKIPQFMRDTVHCRSVLQNIFAAGQAAEREACAEIADGHIIKGLDRCVGLRVAEFIRKRGEVLSETI